MKEKLGKYGETMKGGLGVARKENWYLKERGSEEEQSQRESVG